MCVGGGNGVDASNFMEQLRSWWSDVTTVERREDRPLGNVDALIVLMELQFQHKFPDIKAASCGRMDCIYGFGV